MQFQSQTLKLHESVSLCKIKVGCKMYISREIEELLDVALKQFPACLITGPRQAGKSTLLQNKLKNYRYVTLDDPLIRELANEDPRLFLNNYKAPLIIDEIQYAPGLLSYLKIAIDENRDQYGQYVLTGSQIFQLMKGVSESLAGRIAIFNLYPLSWQEILKVPGHSQDSLNDQLTASQTVRGFYPELFKNRSKQHELWYSSYLSTYIERDVRNIKSITDLGRFQMFIGLLAARAGKLLNMSEISKECGVSQPTVRDWLSVLESTYMIYLLKPYHHNLSKRMVKSPKLYFVDTGLLCYLLGIDNEDRFFKSAERGSVFENMVVMEYVKRFSAVSGRTQFYFYRSASGVEVDLLIEKEGKMNGYEIKLSKTLSREMAASLTKVKDELGLNEAYVLSLQDDSFPLSPTVHSLHWSQVT